MKLLCTGDWHLRGTRPINRTDADYSATQFRKIQWIFEQTNRNRCSAILQAGDMFDYFKVSTVPYFVVNSLIHHIKKHLSQIGIDYNYMFTVRGQHCVRYTNDLEDAPLPILLSSNLVRMVDDNPYFLPNGHRLYGASYEEEVPKVKSKSAFNILIIHRMITKDGPLWYNQKDYITASNFLKKYPDFDLVVSGDNHHAFQEVYRGRTLINCGSLCRSNIDQTDHKPQIVIFDTETKKMKILYIPIDKEVFKPVLSDGRENLESLIDELEDNDEVDGIRQSIDILKMIFEAMNDLEENVKRTLEVAIERVRSKRQQSDS